MLSVPFVLWVNKMSSMVLVSRVHHAKPQRNPTLFCFVLRFENVKTFIHTLA